MQKELGWSRIYYGSMNSWRNCWSHKQGHHGLVVPKMCLWASGNTHSCLLEMVDVCNEPHPTMAAFGEQGAWEWIQSQVSASLMHHFSSLTPGMELVRVWDSFGIISTKLQARTELFLVVCIGKRPILHIVLLVICWITGQSMQWEENHLSGKEWWHMLKLLWEFCLALDN